MTTRISATPEVFFVSDISRFGQALLPVNGSELVGCQE
jgi:hypothetical protein